MAPPFFRLVFVLFLHTVPCRCAEPTLFETAHPFRAVSRWLVSSDSLSHSALTDRTKSSLCRSEGAVKRALLMLSKTQLMTKGVDGAAFQLSVATGRGAASRSNITSEIAKLRELVGTEARQDHDDGNDDAPVSKSSSRKPNVAAAKLVHKAQTVQRALRAAELVELARAAQQILLVDAWNRSSSSCSNGSVAGLGVEENTGWAALLRDGGWSNAATAASVELAAPPVLLRVPLAGPLGTITDYTKDGDLDENQAAVEKKYANSTVCVLLLRDLSGNGASNGTSNTTLSPQQTSDQTNYTLAFSDTLCGSELLEALSAKPTTISSRVAAAAGGQTRVATTFAAARHSSASSSRPSTQYRRAAVAPAVLRTAIAVLRSLKPFLTGNSKPIVQGDGNRGLVSGIRRCVPHPVRRLECVGHSFSGSVAALVSALFDGTLTVSEPQSEMSPPLPQASGSGEEEGAAFSSDVKQGDAREVVSSASLESPGFGSGEVQSTCVVLGPCPCVGSSVSLPGITSLVLGDDLIARLQPLSLRRLHERVDRFLVASPDGDSQGVFDASKGAVKLAAKLSSAWVGDALGSTVHNMKHRSAMDTKTSRKKRRKKSKNTSRKPAVNVAQKNEDDVEHDDGHEEQLLLCPGLVYLLKPRASGDVVVTTTKRGGLGESLLMSMHDVLLSKSMLAHHLLGAYVHALDKI